MDATVIGLVMTGLIGVILLISFFFGVKRGLKKSAFRLGWIIVTIVLLVFLTPVISTTVNRIDISSFNLDIMGPVNKLSDIGVNLIINLTQGEDLLANSSAVTEFAKNISVMLLNVVLFVVLFWLIKWLLWPIWAVISSRIFDKEKRERKRLKKELKKKQKKEGIVQKNQNEAPQVLTVQESKFRIWGGIVGLVLGLLICSVTFSPIIGLNAVFQNVNANVTTVNEDGETVPFLSTQLDEQTLGYINSYNDSIGSKILEYTATGMLSQVFFDKMMSVNVKKENVEITNEIETAVRVYKDYTIIENIDTENLTSEDLDIILSTVKEISTTLTDSKILYLLGNEVVPYYLDQYISQEDFVFVDDEEIDRIIKDAYERISSSFNLKQVQNELECLVDIALELNKAEILLPIVKGEITLESAVSLIAENVISSSMFADNVVDNLFKISLIKNKYPDLANEAIKSVYDSLGLVFSDQTLTLEVLNNNLKVFVQNAVDICKYYNDSVSYDFGNNTLKMANSVGNILDVFKTSILIEDNYSALISYLTTKINEVFSDTIDISSITNNFINVESWVDELTSLSSLYKNGVKLYNSEPTIEKFINKENNFIENLGVGINNAVKGSRIVTNESLKELIESYIDKIEISEVDEILNIEIEEGLTLKDYVLNNIYDGTRSQILNWEDEFIYNLDVIRQFYKLIDGGINVDELAKEDNTLLSDLGLSFDYAIQKNTKLLISNKVLRELFDYFVSSAELGDSAQEVFDIEYDKLNNISVYDAILNNIFNKIILTTQVSSWQNELLKVKEIITTPIDTNDLISMGSMLDSVSGSKIISKSIVDTVVSYYIDKETSTLPEGLTTGQDSAVYMLKRNLVQVESYEKEFEYVKEIIDVLNATYEDNYEKLVAFGNVFNKVSDFDYSAGISSKLFTKTVLNKFLSYYFDDYVKNNLGSIDEKLKNAINIVKDNLGSIKDYKKEFENIIEIADYIDGTIPDKNNDSVGSLKDIGMFLDEIDSEIIDTTVIREMIAFYIEDNTKNLSYDLKTIVNKIITNVKDENIVVSSYLVEFDLLDTLTKSISEETLNYAEIGKNFDTANDKSAFINRTILEDFILYFFNDFINDELSGNDNEKLRNIVENIKSNVGNIVSFEKEFVNIETLINNVTNTDKLAIGEAFDTIIGNNSVFITKANLDEIIVYFIDDYIINKIDAEVNANLVSAAESIKENVSNIQSYTFEFNNLELLFNIINDSDKKKIGEVLDTIITNNSKLILKSNIEDIVCGIFDKFVTDNLAGQNNEELREIVNRIKLNIQSVTSYKDEITYIELLFEKINSSEYQEIGETLDTIKIGSKLISNNNISEIMLYFFNKNVEDVDSKYSSVIDLVKSKIFVTNDEQTLVQESISQKQDGYKLVLSEIKTLADDITKFSNLSSIDVFNNENEIGSILDEIANTNTNSLQIIEGQDIAYKIAKIAFDTILGYVEKDYSTEIKNSVETDVLNNSVYRFDTYEYKYLNDNDENTNFEGTYGSDDYFNSLISDLQAKLLEINL